MGKGLPLMGNGCETSEASSSLVAQMKADKGSDEYAVQWPEWAAAGGLATFTGQSVVSHRK